MPRNFFLLIMLLVGASPAATFAQPMDLGWREFRNDRFGLVLRYPAEVFVSQRSSDSGDGDLFETPDRRGRLLVGNISRRARTSPSSQDNLIRDFASTTRRSARAGRSCPAPSARRWSMKKLCLAAAAT